MRNTAVRAHVAAGYWLKFILLVMLVPASGSTPAAAQGGPSYGMNYMFYTVDSSRVPDCRRDRRATIKGREFLTRYQDPTIRRRVNAQLRAMRRSGFREIRTIILFARSEKQPADWFHVDRDQATAAAAVRAYAEDLARAGFSELELSFGPLGELRPYCRRPGPGAAWGDCFKPDSIAATVKFIAAVRRGLGDPPLPLRVDISNESCSSTDLPLQLQSKMQTYLATLLRSYPAAFARDRLTASCTLERFPKARASIDRAFAAAGRSPDFYELHAYHHPHRNVAGVLSQVRAALANTTQPATLGEVTYGDSAYVRQLVGNIPRLRSVDFWPLARLSSGCGLDTAPPYSLRSAFGAR